MCILYGKFKKLWCLKLITLSHSSSFVHLLLELPGRVRGIISNIVKWSFALLAFLRKKDMICYCNVIGWSFKYFLLSQLKFVWGLDLFFSSSIFIFPSNSKTWICIRPYLRRWVVLSSFLWYWSVGLIFSQCFLKFQHARGWGKSHSFDFGKSIFSFIIIYFLITFILSIITINLFSFSKALSFCGFIDLSVLFVDLLYILLFPQRFILKILRAFYSLILFLQFEMLLGLRIILKIGVKVHRLTVLMNFMRSLASWFNCWEGLMNS